jgi:hypothetical protein
MGGQSFLFMNYFCALGAENSQKLVYNSELNQHKRGFETTSCSALSSSFCVSVLCNKAHKVPEIEMQCFSTKLLLFKVFYSGGCTNLG